jgi:hypothetical protein
MGKPFKGVINLDVMDSIPDWEPYEQPRAPEGSPNVLFIVWDDLGFGAWEPFGGPIKVPNMRRLADSGQVEAASSPKRSLVACRPYSTDWAPVPGLAARYWSMPLR